MGRYGSPRWRCSCPRGPPPRRRLLLAEVSERSLGEMEGGIPACSVPKKVLNFCSKSGDLRMLHLKYLASPFPGFEKKAGNRARNYKIVGARDVGHVARPSLMFPPSRPDGFFSPRKKERSKKIPILEACRDEFFCKRKEPPCECFINRYFL